MSDFIRPPSIEYIVYGFMDVELSTVDLWGILNKCDTIMIARSHRWLNQIVPRCWTKKNPGQFKTALCVEVIVDQTANEFQHDV